MTGDWATIAFHSRTQESTASFDIKAATITASGNVWGRWSEHASYPKQHGPTRQSPFSDNEEPQDEALDQCIFIDSFRIADLAWYKRIVLSVTQKSGSTMLTFPTPSNTGGGAGQTFPSQGSSSRQVIMGSGSGSTKPYVCFMSVFPDGALFENIQDEIEVLTAYEVLAFHAFLVREDTLGCHWLTWTDWLEPHIGIRGVEAQIRFYLH